MTIKLAHSAKKLNYIVSENQTLITKQINDKDLYSIKANGQGVSLVIIMHNRASLTIRLLESLQNEVNNYQGEIIVFDNQSDSKEIDKIENYLKNYPLKNKFIKKQKNYGIGPARNRAIKHAKNKWVLFLDNDIYFVGNPFPSILKTIEETGAHFINIPLLDSDRKTIFCYGGVLAGYPEGKEVIVGPGSAYHTNKNSNDNPIEPFLSTFLYGGTIIVNKETFSSLGGFDERYFIGYEDVEFSLRLFNKGYKIGNASTLSLVHDNKQAQEEANIDYIKIRNNEQIVKRSIDYLEKDYNVKICRSGLSWLKKRKEDYRIFNTHNFRDKKPQVTVYLVVDTKGWAFDNIAQELLKNKDKSVEIKLIYAEAYSSIIDLLLDVSDADVIHFFFRNYISLLLDFYSCERRCNDLDTNFWKLIGNLFANVVLTTGVHDHFFMYYEEEYSQIFDTLCPQYYTINKKLFEFYNNAPHAVKPLAVIADRIDIKPYLSITHKSKYKNANKRTIKIGWAGNSKAGQWIFCKYPNNENYYDLKGLKTIIVPAIDILKKKGYQVELVSQDSTKERVDKMGMVNFYSSIDIYICGSKSEGTPHPILEAMATGLPIVSTDVGIVKEIFGPKQQKFICNQFTSTNLAEKLELLINHSEQWESIKEENKKQVIKWHKESLAADYVKFFKKAYYNTELNEILSAKRLRNLERFKHYYSVAHTSTFLKFARKTWLVQKLLKYKPLYQLARKIYFILMRIQKQEG